ncbi:MAG TPA: DUF4350 domain-containing protein [Pyrinomonadaceae bacterium]|jgi:hypothetical protein
MKQRILVLLMVVGLVTVLVLLNAASYVQTQQTEDSELTPNRSTFNPGPTGTQALFALLTETGRKPIRWQDAPDTLSTTKNKPAVFIMIGSLRRPVSENDATSLLRWVSQGGRLVVIDRDPPKDLCTTTANWNIAVSTDPAIDLLSVDPADQEQMTSGVEAAKPVQPSLYTAGVNAIQPSRFSAWVSIDRLTKGYGIGNGRGIYRSPTPPPPVRHEGADEDKSPRIITSSSPDDDDEGEASDSTAEPAFNGPVVHISGSQKNLLVDVPFGQGSIVYLADPYIVSNGGIKIVDNAQLALNILATSDGPVAFDEYHQGYGANSNRLFAYFSGTPVIAIFLQCALVIALVLLSQSRRFARPLPGEDQRRLSKLEYVTAMAELQQRTRAYDLAMENVYMDFRRRLSRAFGFDNVTTARREIAQMIAERASIGADGVNALMLQCEAIIQGEPTNRSETVSLVARLREIEDKLGLRRKPRGKPAV